MLPNAPCQRTTVSRRLLSTGPFISLNKIQFGRKITMQPKSKSIATAFFPGKSQIVQTVGTPSAGTGVARSLLHCNLSVLATLSLLLLASLTNLRAATVQVQV